MLKLKMSRLSILKEGRNTEFVETHLCIGDDPSGDTWYFNILLKPRMNGDEDHAWQIGFNGERMITIHGIIGMDGSIQRTERDIKVNQSGRDLRTQALLETRSRYKRKYDSGYRTTAEKQTPISLCRVMLASQYKEGSTKLKFPCIGQPKIDGIRCVSLLGEVSSEIRVETKEIVLRSREGKEFNHLEHIRCQLLDMFQYFPGGTILDGELYCHSDMTFNELVSAVKTSKCKTKDNGKVQYWIFDWINYDIPNWERMMKLKRAYNAWVDDCEDDIYIKLVNTSLIENKPCIMSLYNECLRTGYEGIMLRHHECVDPKKAMYKPDRSTHLLKVKQFEEAEAIVVDVESAQGKDEGTAIFVLEDITGKRFRARPRGTLETRRIYLEQKNDLIGRLYTYTYFELTDDGLPRFPVGKEFRDYE